MKKLFFESNRPCITHLPLVFDRKNKKSEVLNEANSTGNSTQKDNKLSLTVYPRLFSKRQGNSSEQYSG